MLNYINPQSQVKLLNVDIEINNKNQYTFSSEEEQTDFFMSKSVGKDFFNMTFVRDGMITVRGQVYDLYNANYMMFQNTGFSDKWFYAFITKIEYVSQNDSNIYYEIDPFQSWYFKLKYGQSFVIRKHVTDDSIGANTIDENLGFGDYIFYKCQPLDIYNDFYVIMAVSEVYKDDSTQWITAPGGVFDGVYSGFRYYVLPNASDAINAFINSYSGGKTEAIQFMYLIPKKLLGGDIPIPPGTYLSDNAKGQKWSIPYDFDDQTTINGYAPKNNKLFCYPYNVIELTDNCGKSAIYKPELFSSRGAAFSFISTVTGNPSITCFPTNYDNIMTDIANGIVSTDLGICIGNFPQCNWVSDFYKNWLAQNSYGNNIQLALGVGNGITNIGLGVATGNPISGIIGLSSLASSIGSYFTQNYKAQITPDQARGNTSNINTLMGQGLLGFYVNHKTIKKEYAKIIDDYFTMFGYKVNSLEVPNLRSRLHWNYIETKDIQISAPIPNEHLEKIKEMFDTGVTLWHDDNVGNYNRSNPNR